MSPDTAVRISTSDAEQRLSCVLHVVGFDFANKIEVKLQLDQESKAED